MIPKREGDGPEVEQIETRELVAVDFFVEQEPGGVELTLACDDLDDDLAVILTPEKARELGELLFARGCQAEYGDRV